MGAPDIALGIDLGSRTTKLVELRGGEVARFEIFGTTHESLDRVRAFLASGNGASSAATGYGRHLVNSRLSCRVVTEIKACALGARHFRPGCGLVIDIGGQDTKAVALDASGGFRRFEMNDRCAAGTGRFLEVMAGILGYSLEEFGRQALASRSAATISSLCTVFAESEVISLLTSGQDRQAIARGLHLSVVDRVFPLAAKLDAEGEVLISGGVALNPCVVDLLARALGRPVVVPENPQLVTAVGAALTVR
jgi:predicted CoA-substrate-specific enzyme activase